MNKTCLSFRSLIFLTGFLLPSLLIACTQTDEPAATPPPPPLVTEQPAPDTLETLLNTEQPTRDVVLLATQYKNVEIPESISHPATDTAVFWYNHKDTDVYEQTNVERRYHSDTLSFWLEDSSWVTDRAARDAAEHIEHHIVPINRELFGTEWNPGIDGEPQIHIFNAEDIGESVLGYFSSADEFPASVNPFSNEREMMYLNLNKLDLGSDEYHSVIAHEYQHMIHWHLDRNETIWLNEGMSEVAAAVNGYGDSQHMPSFLSNPDTPLTYFDYEGGDYGAAYLFSRYLLDRFGRDFVRDLAQHPDNGMVSVETVLADHGHDLLFDQLFQEWIAVTYAASNKLTTDLPMYDGVVFPRGFFGENLDAGDNGFTDVSPYGTDYYRVSGGEPITFVFTGTRSVPLIDTLPVSGEYLWSTLPADSQDASLTREFDLTAVPTATLQFSLWYDIELGWDYAYLSVSTDGGDQWTTIQTVNSNEANPNGNNLGYGYTGTSGSLEKALWVPQTADLTPYAGQKTLLRFQYVTDTAIHQQGLALDDLAIPEIGFFDDAETDTAGWQTAGFARHTNQLPQTFIVQQFLIDEEGHATVDQLRLAEDNHGRWTIPLTTTHPRAVIAISSVTPITFQPASYQYQTE